MERLISKKELLARYSISYGALYRWKRRGLIPEDWFLKKSTVTGQETFFREEQICPRVEQILAARDEASLTALEQQLGSEEEDSRRLVVVTTFEEKLFRLSELRSIRILDGGKEIDLTSRILQEIEKGGKEDEN